MSSLYSNVNIYIFSAVIHVLWVSFSTFFVLVAVVAKLIDTALVTASCVFDYSAMFDLHSHWFYLAFRVAGNTEEWTDKEF